ncbi:MAG: response regulator transcription factor [Blautia sp.]|jgi:two-component system response regulator YesN
MIRTLITDDEYWVCQLICDLIDWNSYGFEIIGQANNGEEALNKIVEEKPDLVFTDIKMPGISGLELVERCKLLSPQTKFVIISGHSEFEYAKSALNSGVLGYLLKPVEAEELIGLLTEIRNTFLSQYQNIMENMQLQQQLMENNLRLKEQYFLTLLGKIDLIDAMPLPLINSKCSSHFGEGLFQVYQYTLDTPIPLNSYDTALDLISSKIYGEVAGLCIEVVAVKQHASLICLTNFHPDNGHRISKVFRDVFYSVKHNIPSIPDCNITLGIGCVTDHNISRSFATASDSINARIKLGSNRIIDFSNTHYEDVPLSKLFLSEDKQTIKDYILKHSEAVPEEIIGQIIYRNFYEQQINPSAIFKLVHSVIEYMYSVPTAENIDITAVMPLDSALHTAHSFSTTEQMIHFIASLLEKLKELCSCADASDSAAQQIKNYIDTHFAEEVFLSSLSEIVHLNSKYISDLFRKEYDITITDYVTQKRMDEAKILLLRRDDSITEISEQVGYHDPKYFTRLFKRFHGISPAQFRKLYK